MILLLPCTFLFFLALDSLWCICCCRMEAGAAGAAGARKRRVYEIVAEQRARRGAGELGVPRHQPRRRCDAPSGATHERSRDDHKQLALSTEALAALLTERCCNEQCGGRLAGQAAEILHRRRLHHLLPSAIDRRHQLEKELVAGYYVSFFLSLFFPVA